MITPILLTLGALLIFSPRRKRPRKSKKKASWTENVVANVMRWLPLAREAVATYPSVSLPLLLTIMHIESQGDPEAQSHAGAQGLMQVLRPYQKHYGIYNWRDPKQSTMGGAKILAEKIAEANKKYGGNQRYAIAAYNRGSGTIEKYGIDAKGREYLALYDAAFPHYKNIR
jgi:soluble lytic murein transglycosylase-like protein